MAGDRESLRETLERLQAQLDEMRQVDPSVAAHLDSTIEEAKAALGGRPIERAVHRSIVKRLSEAVTRYEASHPSLSGGLGRIVDALSQMGI